MKIKKLTVQGFKSFVDRLEIVFPHGISGVVGPNGCGKSNIVDAIRWCLGEQSPKQLRGRRMEDIIFNGAGDYKAVGMAEVSLLFENGDGSFPPAFTQSPELSVTRRLYRSGESEYLINNVPCRLKDIQEIFMDTGLGNRAYSIIGQGQIGTIVEQKPEETRIMLEEAAGITKYKRKVEASRRKIEQTEANLRRVQDIQIEIERQMRSLKRQAAKAKRYKAICDEIRDLDIILSSNSYNQLNNELNMKQKSTDDLSHEEIALSTSLSQKQARIESLNMELEAMDSELAERRKAFLELKERVHMKEARIESLSGEMKMLEELEKRLFSEQEEITHRLMNLNEEMGLIDGKISMTEQKTQEIEAETALKRERLDKKRELLKTVKDEYEKARSDLNEGANKEVGLNHESGYLNRMLSQTTDGRSRISDEIKEITEKIKEVNRASDLKRDAREATALRMKDIEGGIEDQEMAYEEMGQVRSRLEADLKTVEAELNMTQSRLSSLQALTENFEGYKMGVRTVMKAENLKVMGLVADIIQVRTGYEQAVEAVLSDRLQYVVVESQDAGKKAVDYLKERERGRGSFVPLSEIKENGRQSTDPSPYTSLAEFVNVDEAFRPLISSLLGDCVLVDNLDDAISAWRNNGKNTCFVTLEGDMVDQKGVISGGKLSKSSQGLLTRKREMSLLEEKATKLSQKCEELNEKLEQIDVELQEKSQVLERLGDDKWTCQDEINEYDKKLFRLGQELDQMEKYVEKLNADLSRMDIEENKHKRELIRVEEELKRRREYREKEEFYFQEKERELKECEEEFDKSKEELTAIQTDQRILIEEQRSLARERASKEKYAEESQKRLAAIEEDISLGRNRFEECGVKRETSKNELGALSSQLNSSQDDLNRADNERQAFHSTIKEEEKKEQLLRDKIEELKERISRAKMEHSEIKFRMTGLVDRVREKFGLHLSEIFKEYLKDDFSHRELEEKLEHKKNLKQKLGEVNLTAIKEHEALKERHEFIKGQREDLINSIESLVEAIKRINRTSLERFKDTFEQVDTKLKEIFPVLFGGGTACLRLTDESKPLESGVLVEVQPPGKKLSHMGLLSGGEKALVAMALLFAIYMIKPSPFCLLDEVDAPLDEANIDRFNNLLIEIKRNSQIIMVTHSRRTMEITDRLYGVTMEKAGISKTVTVDLEGVKDHLEEQNGTLAASIH